MFQLPHLTNPFKRRTAADDARTEPHQRRQSGSRPDGPMATPKPEGRVTREALQLTRRADGLAFEHGGN
jgi:hypothetical protein